MSMYSVNTDGRQIKEEQCHDSRLASPDYQRLPDMKA